MEEFARAVILFGIPAIFGSAFVERLGDILFGHDPLLTLLCPQPPNRRILLSGERGTGKESLAHILGIGLGALSGGRPLLAVNAAALPETLLESTLFGHVKGAFTGATATHVGLIDQLHQGGVLFFDEAAEASPALQAKLLRVFQTGEYTPVGAPGRMRRADFHVIGATNVPLDQIQAGHHMRADLYDRLAAPVIVVPPLRELLTEPARARAILQSVALRVIRELSAEGRGSQPAPTIKRKGDSRAIDFELWATPRAARIARTIEERTRGYHWPGNLREAAQLIRQSLFLGSSAISVSQRPQPQQSAENPNEITLRVPRAATLKAQLEAAERELYQRAAVQCASINEVANELGIARQTASRRMEQLGIESPRARKKPARLRASEDAKSASKPSAPAPSPVPDSSHRPHQNQSVDVFSAFTQCRIDRTLATVLGGHRTPSSADMVATVENHVAHLLASVEEHRFIDPTLAQGLSASLIALAQDVEGSQSEAHLRLVAAAVHYFAEVEDEDHDLHSAIGLDDDIRVMNEVAHLLGRDDLVIEIDI
ncbi:MAG: hypothetical protein ACJAYU_002335 [Bradymonadia bacterium]|jgi:hypothetical protein